MDVYSTKFHLSSLDKKQSSKTIISPEMADLKACSQSVRKVKFISQLMKCNNLKVKQIIRLGNNVWGTHPFRTAYFGIILQFFQSCISTCNFGLAMAMQYSKFGNVIRNIQNKLGNRALKSDLKSTVIRMLT